MGRLPAKINIKEVEALMAFYPSLSEVSGWFQTSEDTIQRLIKEHYALNFADFRMRFMGKTKINLKRIAIQKALDGNDKMLLHCLRVLTNMDDRPVEKPSVSGLDDDELIAEAKELLSRAKN